MDRNLRETACLCFVLYLGTRLEDQILGSVMADPSKYINRKEVCTSGRALCERGKENRRQLDINTIICCSFEPSWHLGKEIVVLHSSALGC